ncbi:hypothetical protein CL622_03735 [archaeon]|nr:hypothetical protein [archaeon]
MRKRIEWIQSHDKCTGKCTHLFDPGRDEHSHQRKHQCGHGVIFSIEKNHVYPDMKRFYSQYRQDRWLFENRFNKPEYVQNGFFVDIGAHDGVSLNNTLFFENELGWKGLNVEANPDVFKKLEQNRPDCINECIAIGDTDQKAVPFLCNTGYTEMLSGLVNAYDPRHMRRIQNEIRQHGGTSKTISVPMMRMDTLLAIYDIKHIDYLSIDVEGNEKQVLESIDFDAVTIDVIGFEVNFKDQARELYSVLEPHGYKLLTAKGCDLIVARDHTTVA